uniref:Uncharacterized protein n=1 Tax=Arundo donax TaxID=35708 RepID=A0A0A9AXF0_ARUDO
MTGRGTMDVGAVPSNFLRKMTWKTL